MSALDIEKAAEVLRDYYIACRDADEGGDPAYEADWIPLLDECIQPTAAPLTIPEIQHLWAAIAYARINKFSASPSDNEYLASAEAKLQQWFDEQDHDA